MTVVNETRRSGVRARALAIGAICSAIAAVAVTWAEMVVSSIRIGYLNFPPAALGLLMIVICINRTIKFVTRRAGLNVSDLLVIYSMILVATLVSSHGVAQKLVPLLAISNNFADNNNNWGHLFNPHIRPELVPWDVRLGDKQNVIAWYYNKLPRGQVLPWWLWVRPLLTWGILIALVLGAYLCLAAILRRQWVDNEKLSFPLAQLPMEMAADEERHSFWSNKTMWVGALIPIVVFGLKGLHQVYPTVPDIILQWNLSDYVTTMPWVGLGYTSFLVSFAAIGFFYLLPADVLFSIWFFYLLSKAMILFAVQFNFDAPDMPQFGGPIFIEYQTVGAYVALVAYFYWIARPHLRKVYDTALGRIAADDADEIMSYKTAFWGLVGCVIGGAAWLVWAGMSWWVAALEIIGSVFIISLVMARSTAEAGMLMTETSFSPTHLYRMFAPMHNLGAANITMVALFDSLVPHDQRALLLTGMLDGSRIADGTNVRRRAFAGIFVIGIVVALIVAVCLNVYLPYVTGATNMDSWLESGSSRWILQDNSHYFSAGQTISPTAVWQMPVFFVVGLVVTGILTSMRATFYWWPFHPIGYALMGTWSTTEFWFAALIAWILKTVSVRYGGMGFFTKARPFFLGLVIGEFGMAVFYVIVNWVGTACFHVKIPVPAFPWG